MGHPLEPAVGWTPRVKTRVANSLAFLAGVLLTGCGLTFPSPLSVEVVTATLSAEGPGVVRYEVNAVVRAGIGGGTVIRSTVQVARARVSTLRRLVHMNAGDSITLTDAGTVALPPDVRQTELTYSVAARDGNEASYGPLVVAVFGR